MMIRQLQKSLSGRVIGLLILVFGLVNAVTVYIYYEERGRAVRWTHMEDLVTRSASVQRLLNDTPAELHAQILESVSTDLFRFAIQPLPAVTEEDLTEQDHPLYQNLINKTDGMGPISLSISPRYYWCYSWIQNLLNPQLFLNQSDNRRPLAIVSIRRDQEGWLNGTLMSSSVFPGWLAAVLAALGLFVFTVVAIVLIVRYATRSLDVLIEASDQLGRGETVGPVPDEGPEDVRRTIYAFNRMRERIERFVKNRTLMLAAISHDLRTPLTSLRLQAEFIDDLPTRQRMLRTLDDMQEMTEATLAFTREDIACEDKRCIDIAALIESQCDDLSEMGLNVSCDELQRTPYNCSPGAMKRALANLIENACHYGESARVSLTQLGDELHITVKDQGPGIPEADWNRVFDPFVRLENSRNRHTGGIGLGMAIARTIAHAHGGDIALRNLKPKGLEVKLSLPLN